MVEHRNVVELLRRHGRRASAASRPGVWLAVTSLSFDISVLELFWTLARGFTVVLSGDENRALVSGGAAARSPTGRSTSACSTGATTTASGRSKYELLLEGAKFADAHGFCAVWTPERHFHAFGGPYPNPSVTGAAVAAVTRNLGVRAGSCVRAAAPPRAHRRGMGGHRQPDRTAAPRSPSPPAGSPTTSCCAPRTRRPPTSRRCSRRSTTLRRLWRGEAVRVPDRRGHAVRRRHPAAPGLDGAADLGHHRRQPRHLEGGGRARRQRADPPARPDRSRRSPTRSASTTRRCAPPGHDPARPQGHADAAHLRRRRPRGGARDRARADEGLPAQRRGADQAVRLGLPRLQEAGGRHQPDAARPRSR